MTGAGQLLPFAHDVYDITVLGTFRSREDPPEIFVGGREDLLPEGQQLPSQILRERYLTSLFFHDGDTL